MALVMMVPIFSNITPLSLVKLYQRFGGTYYLYLGLRRTTGSSLVETIVKEHHRYILTSEVAEQKHWDTAFSSRTPASSIQNPYDHIMEATKIGLHNFLFPNIFN
jgi:hypothetical protein